MKLDKNNSKIVLSAHNLRKSYVDHQDKSKRIYALNGLSLDVYQGEVLGILGPNGAGKTTFLNTVSTLLLADEGQVEILGIPAVPQHFNAIRGLINMSSGYPNYAFCLTVRENLEFYGRLYGLSGEALRRKVDEVMELFSLNAFAGRKFDELSSGTKQRLSLAKALLNDPKVLFLDEPTIGLDPDVALKTRQIVLEVLQKRNVTVLLTSHNMDEVEAMCDRVAFIQKGTIVKLSSVDELKKLHNTDDLEEVFIRLASQTHAQQEPQAPLTNQQKLLAQVDSSRRGLWFNRAFAFFMRSSLFARRNLFVMTDLFFWPMISLISIGLMSKFVNLGDNMFSFMMTGAMAAGILQIAQLDVGYTVLYELWSKSLKHTLLTPVGVSEGVMGTWVIGIMRGSLTFLLLAFGASFFGFHLPGFMPTILFLFGIYLCALILGIMVNILILSFGQKVEITAWMFAHLFMILCGIYYPINVLPQAFQYLALAIPITHFLEYFRQGYGFSAHTPYPFLSGVALSLLYIYLSLKLLSQAYTRARRKGIVIRLSE